MRWFGARCVSVAVVLATTVLTGCLDPYRRIPGPRALETIFSPLDLPTPDGVRTASGTPGPEYWQQQVDYQIDATLDEESFEISATARITYTNNSPDDLDMLWLHLEQNIFRKDSAGALCVPPSLQYMLESAEEGGLSIESVRSNGRDLPLQVFGTVGRIDLPEPIAARGGTLTFEISWSFNVRSEGTFRMGVEGTEQGPIFEVAQWIPAPCVYDDVHGWNTLPYLGMGEFYTNFGSFDVRLTVPRSHIAVATGVLHNPQDVLTDQQIDRLDTARTSEETVLIRGAEEVTDPASRPVGDGPLTWHFVAHDVRTFAWASSAAFIWDAAGIPERGTTPAEAAGTAPDLPVGTLVQSVYPKEALPLWEKSTDMLRFAIEGYNRRWVTYPYPVATNVNGIAGGMEYPMIIFCAERKDENALYWVTAHEIGHTWFPMMVNTDERRHAWMDEGFNCFMNTYSVEERFPDDTSIEDEMEMLLMALKFIAYQPSATPPDQTAFMLFPVLQYGKPAWGLHVLREIILGPERFDHAFKRYINAWAFKSPQPADFFRCIENAAGKDLSWFWRGWFHETGTLDQAVVGVDQGWWGRGPVRVTFHNHGELVMPVIYRVKYSDKSTEMRRLPVEVWHRTDRWTTSWDPGDRRVTEILIDPDEVLPDVSRRNNRWRPWW